MKNHSRHTPFRMCVVALFFVLAWWRVFMTNSLPAKTARKLQANRNFWKAAAILKPVGRELGLRGVMDFDRHFDQGLSKSLDKVYETQKRSKKPSLMWILWLSDLRKWKTRRLIQHLTFWKYLHIEEGTGGGGTPHMKWVRSKES